MLGSCTRFTTGVLELSQVSVTRSNDGLSKLLVLRLVGNGVTARRLLSRSQSADCNGLVILQACKTQTLPSLGGYVSPTHNQSQREDGKTSLSHTHPTDLPTLTSHVKADNWFVRAMMVRCHGVTNLHRKRQEPNKHTTLGVLWQLIELLGLSRVDTPTPTPTYPGRPVHASQDRSRG